jgi:hypothetical protein
MKLSLLTQSALREKNGAMQKFTSIPLNGTGKPCMTGPPHHVVIRGLAVGCLLLKSFRANQGIFQLMMLSYNLFLLFKLDFLGISVFRQQISCGCGTGAGKTFRLKFVLFAGKIIRTARYVVMKLPAKYPFRDVYQKCMTYLSVSINPTCFSV